MILLVDDHDDTRLALQKILELEGYQAYGVSSGGAALAFLGEFTPRLVIVDYTMPDMDGLSLVREMKQDVRLANVRTILFTAQPGDELRQQARLLGIDAYVVKASLDWMKLHQEIVRLAGPPPAMPRLPSTARPSESETG